MKSCRKASFISLIPSIPYVINAFIYRKILKKIDLSRIELLRLKDKLTTSDICYGPFVLGDRVCPSTAALAIKLKPDTQLHLIDIKRVLRQHGVGTFCQVLFYITFDMPSSISARFFKKQLQKFRTVINKLVQSPSK